MKIPKRVVGRVHKAVKLAEKEYSFTYIAIEEHYEKVSKQLCCEWSVASHGTTDPTACQTGTTLIVVNYKNLYNFTHNVIFKRL